MKIDKTLYKLDDILLLPYGDIVNLFEIMDELDADIYFKLLELDPDDEEYEQIQLQKKYLRKNIETFEKALEIIEKNLVREYSINGTTIQIALN